MVGTVEELRILEEILGAVKAGGPRFAVIGGEPGIGKSRLLDECARRARAAGFLPAIGRCGEEEGAPAFWPWIQVAREICLDPRTEATRTTLAREAPEIAQSVPGVSESVRLLDDRLPAQNARFRLFDGFAQFVSQAASELPLAVLLDDVHRADLDSLLLLEFLLGTCAEATVAVVATYRSPELRRSPERFHVVSRLLRRCGGTAVQPSGFSSADISNYVRGVGGWSPSAEQVRRLEDLTGGNPFFLSQLTSILRRDGAGLRDAARSLPATVRDAILDQLRNLSPEVQEALDVASVVGREFDVPILARVLGPSALEITRALEEAVEAGVVTAREEAGRFRFVHVLVRDVLYEGLGSDRRARLHKAVGEALERIGIYRDGRISEIAVHFSEAAVLGDVGKAVSLCSQAAAAARSAVAYGEAAELGKRALRILEQFIPEDERAICSQLLALGFDQVRAGDRGGAKVTFERAARLAERNREPERVAEAALGVAPGFFAVEAGVHDDLLISLLKRAQGCLRPDQHGLRALVAARLGMALFWSAQDGQSAVLSREAWQICGSSRDPMVRLLVLMARWLAEWMPYEVDSRTAIAQEALQLARSIGDDELLCMALLYGIVGALENADISSFDQMAGEFQRLADRLGQPQALWYSKLIGSTRDLHAGRFARAEEGLKAYFDIGRRIGDANAIHSRMAQRLIHASERGDAAQILAISEEGIERFPIFLGWSFKHI
nr:MAG: hypothetical protein DIU57_19835 [Pseudomonadota bacterium]